MTFSTAGAKACQLLTADFSAVQTPGIFPGLEIFILVC